jgi:hypothetical protein
MKNNGRFITNRVKKVKRLPNRNINGGGTMPIKSYLQDGVFGPEAIAEMGEAFDAACKELQIVDQADSRRALIAALIIAAARRGELNVIRLRTAAVAGFSPAKSHPDLDVPGIKAAS